MEDELVDADEGRNSALNRRVAAVRFNAEREELSHFCLLAAASAQTRRELREGEAFLSSEFFGLV